MIRKNFYTWHNFDANKNPHLGDISCKYFRLAHALATYRDDYSLGEWQARITQAHFAENTELLHTLVTIVKSKRNFNKLVA